MMTFLSESTASYMYMVEKLQAKLIEKVSRDGVVPCLYMLYIHLGDLFRYANHMAEAERSYNKAIALGPGQGNAYNQWAVVCQMQGQDMLAMYGYVRSLAAPVLFVTARGNARLLLQGYHEKVKSMQACHPLQMSHRSGMPHGTTATAKATHGSAAVAVVETVASPAAASVSNSVPAPASASASSFIQIKPSKAVQNQQFIERFLDLQYYLLHLDNDIGTNNTNNVNKTISDRKDSNGGDVDLNKMVTAAVSSGGDSNGSVSVAAQQAVIDLLSSLLQQTAMGDALLCKVVMIQVYADHKMKTREASEMTWRMTGCVCERVLATLYDREVMPTSVKYVTALLFLVEYLLQSTVSWTKAALAPSMAASASTSSMAMTMTTAKATATVTASPGAPTHMHSHGRDHDHGQTHSVQSKQIEQSEQISTPGESCILQRSMQDDKAGTSTSKVIQSVVASNAGSVTSLSSSSPSPSLSLSLSLLVSQSMVDEVAKKLVMLVNRLLELGAAEYVSGVNADEVYDVSEYVSARGFVPFGFMRGTLGGYMDDEEAVSVMTGMAMSTADTASVSVRVSGGAMGRVSSSGSGSRVGNGGSSGNVSGVDAGNGIGGSRRGGSKKQEQQQQKKKQKKGVSDNAAATATSSVTYNRATTAATTTATATATTRHVSNSSTVTDTTIDNNSCTRETTSVPTEQGMSSTSRQSRVKIARLLHVVDMIAMEAQDAACKAADNNDDDREADGGGCDGCGDTDDVYGARNGSSVELIGTAKVARQLQLKVRMQKLQMLRLWKISRVDGVYVWDYQPADETGRVVGADVDVDADADVSTVDVINADSAMDDADVDVVMDDAMIDDTGIDVGVDDETGDVGMDGVDTNPDARTDTDCCADGGGGAKESADVHSTATTDTDTDAGGARDGKVKVETTTNFVADSGSNTGASNDGNRGKDDMDGRDGVGGIDRADGRDTSDRENADIDVMGGRSASCLLYEKNPRGGPSLLVPGALLRQQQKQQHQQSHQQKMVMESTVDIRYRRSGLEDEAAGETMTGVDDAGEQGCDSHTSGNNGSADVGGAALTRLSALAPPPGFGLIPMSRSRQQLLQILNSQWQQHHKQRYAHHHHFHHCCRHQLSHRHLHHRQHLFPLLSSSPLMALIPLLTPLLSYLSVPVICIMPATRHL
jgi:Est1 DNA/RNA binding domain